MRHGACMRPSLRTAPAALLAALAAALATACGGTPPDDAAALARAQAFQQALKQELMAAMAEGGPVRAVAVCSERAPALAQAASTDGFRLRRVGTKTRNLTNSPSKGDGDALDRLRAEATCLLCHGPKVGMTGEMQQALAARYPHDDAFGYALGDLRGAVVVETLR
ncbi:MAG: DUF3365 domain-containing protein [Planctomycetes bacterium]|nr:DUF3365 domain-containing protein [Planctomycetota bacterium]